MAKNVPQAVCTAFISGFKQKNTCHRRVIPDDLLKPLDDIIDNSFLCAITGSNMCSDIERKRLSLPPTKLGCLCIHILSYISRKFK